LHTYAFFIDKTCPWVTPVPDPRLAAARTLTLAQGIDAEATEITVNESTEGMHATTGFFVRNSNVCMIGEELITFTEASQSAPWVIRGCERGALGTQAAPHAAGSTLRHLKECFGLLVPDPETDFLSEVAATQAQFYNECGFDMMYLDALDGEDILGGAENGWHYGSQFVYELFKHLKKPPIMEMSTFHHHLWMVRSRIGAWDHPNRSHKRFIDLHVRENAAHSQIYLPGHLGWWAVKTWGGSLNEPTFSDDIEYLCGKAIGTGVGISVMGIDPVTIREVPAYQRLGALMATYEGLRHANYFTEAQRAELAVPGAEFTLREANGVQRLVRRHSQRRVLDAKTSFTLDNPFATQVPSLRLEGLLECAPEDDPLAVTLFDLCDSSQVSMREAAEGVTLDYDAGEGRISVTNHSAPENGAWAMLHRDLGLLDLSKQLGLGLWVEGDGSGATLNIQLRSPQHLPAGIGEHYVKLNFSGWRYITLIEPEGEAWEAFQWPYGYPYMIHRENVHYDAVASVSVWLNGIPQDKRVSVAIREVRALPLLEGEVVNPGFGIGRESVTLPVTIKTGQYLECGPDGAGVLYGLRGETLAKVCAESPLPTLPQCNGTPASLWYEGTGRVRLTVFTEGEAI